MFPHTFTTPLTVNAEIKRIQTFDDDFMIENNYVDHFQLNLLFNENETNFFWVPATSRILSKTLLSRALCCFN
jgi:hypothetical protein